MRPPSSNKKVQEDFVELPKVNFGYQQPTQKLRKLSGVNIQLPDIEEEEGPNHNLKTHAVEES